MDALTKKKSVALFKWFLVTVWLLVVVLPVLWVFLMSIKTNAQAIEIPPPWSFEPDWSHYIQLFFSERFELRPSMFNSVVISLGSAALSIALSFPAAYSISRFRTGGQNLAFWILSFRMLPPVLFMIPMFTLYLQLGLMDTHIGLIIMYLTFNIPLSVWVLKSFLDDLPKEFEESAMVDGCSRFEAMLRIVFPLCSPGIIAVAILCFFFSFNEFLFAMVFTTRQARTMTVMASIFVTQYTYLWADLAASVILMVIPMMIFVAIIQKELVRGLTMGAIKG